jgi:hypothetical protein
MPSMITELYLLNDSFKYPQKNITKEDLEKKIIFLSEDYDFIKKHNDKILKHDSIYDEVIYPCFRQFFCLMKTSFPNDLLFLFNFSNRFNWMHRITGTNKK